MSCRGDRPAWRAALVSGSRGASAGGRPGAAGAGDGAGRTPHQAGSERCGAGARASRVTRVDTGGRCVRGCPTRSCVIASERARVRGREGVREWLGAPAPQNPRASPGNCGETERARDGGPPLTPSCTPETGAPRRSARGLPRCCCAVPVVALGGPSLQREERPLRGLPRTPAVAMGTGFPRCQPCPPPSPPARLHPACWPTPTPAPADPAPAPLPPSRTGLGATRWVCG